MKIKVMVKICDGETLDDVMCDYIGKIKSYNDSYERLTPLQVRRRGITDMEEYIDSYADSISYEEFPSIEFIKDILKSSEKSDRFSIIECEI